MPTRNVSLTPEQDVFVEQLVESGDYQNASEAIRDGLRALQQRGSEDALKLRALRAHLREGVQAIDDGDYIQLDSRALAPYLRGLSSSTPAPARRRR